MNIKFRLYSTNDIRIINSQSHETDSSILIDCIPCTFALNLRRSVQHKYVRINIWT